MRLQTIELNNLVGEVLDLYRGDDKRLRLTFKPAATLPTVEADAGRMRQLLHNLIKNALEAGAGREQPIALTVGTRCSEGSNCQQVELCVSDDGPGIPEEMLGRLFEPYVTSKPKGTGLGLAIVKKIVEEHGGILTAGNRPEGGAVITVRLPAVARQPAPAPTPTGTE
jgi:nitrogen fixation/metabolism regulation signal transduction histidine kinase